MPVVDEVKVTAPDTETLLKILKTEDSLPKMPPCGLSACRPEGLNNLKMGLAYFLSIV